MTALSAMLAAFRSTGTQAIRITSLDGRAYVDVTVETEDQLRGWAESIDGTKPTYHTGGKMRWLETIKATPELYVVVMTRAEAA